MAKYITLKDLFKNIWTDLIKPKNVCAQAEKFFSSMLEADMTFGEAINSIPEFYENERVDHSWASWMLLNFWESFDSEVRRAFIEKIKHENSLKNVLENTVCTVNETNIILNEINNIKVK